MEKLFIVSLIVIGIIAVITPFFSRNKVQRYIKERKGEHVSTKAMNPHNNKNKSLLVKYYDKHKNLRTVTYYENGLFSFFGEDEIIEYNPGSPEYKTIELKARKRDEQAQQFQGCTYKIKQGDLIIKQEFHHPNIGEFVYLNNSEAQNGKYRLGFMSCVIVENGKVKELTMF